MSITVAPTQVLYADTQEWQDKKNAHEAAAEKETKRKALENAVFISAEAQRKSDAEVENMRAKRFPTPEQLETRNEQIQEETESEAPPKGRRIAVTAPPAPEISRARKGRK